MPTMKRRGRRARRHCPGAPRSCKPATSEPCCVGIGKSFRHGKKRTIGYFDDEEDRGTGNSAPSTQGENRLDRRGYRQVGSAAEDGDDVQVLARLCPNNGGGALRRTAERAHRQLRHAGGGRDADDDDPVVDGRRRTRRRGRLGLGAAATAAPVRIYIHTHHIARPSAPTPFSTLDGVSTLSPATADGKSDACSRDDDTRRASSKRARALAHLPHEHALLVDGPPRAPLRTRPS